MSAGTRRIEPAGSVHAHTPRDPARTLCELAGGPWVDYPCTAVYLDHLDKQYLVTCPSCFEVIHS
jgi:hypothetical protein